MAESRLAARTLNRAWLLCGLSFAGKSTLARAIAELRGATIVSPDDINEERGVGFGGDGLSPSVWAKTLDIAIERLDGAMRRGEEVVVDETCCFRWLRDRYREVAHRHGYEVLLVKLDVPLEEIQRRRASNNEKPDRRAIRDEIFDSHLASFEWPTDDEAAIPYRPGIDIEPWVESLVSPGPDRDSTGR